MQHVHFIAIGGAVMHNLAIAVSKKNSIQVTGSDVEISEPCYSRLKEHGLLPEQLGWNADRINKNIHAVVFGMQTAKDNPELLKAQELGLKIYSVPEYLYMQTRSKTRIVVSGSYGKTTVVAMILHVLKKHRINVDYMLGEPVKGFENMVRLTYESRIAVFEGDEYLVSPFDNRPRFHLLKPHIAVLTGVAWDHADLFPNATIYLDQFRKFVELMEIQGRLIYFDGDINLRDIHKKLRRDIVAFNYNTPEYSILEGKALLKTRKGDIALKIFGEHNLQNLNAARLACRQIGVYDDQFYQAIADFPGLEFNLQKVWDTPELMIIKDSANSPAKLKATINAAKLQFPERELVVVYELQNSSCFNEDFLSQYGGTLHQSDAAYIYYSPQKTEEYQPNEISDTLIVNSFGRDKVKLVTDIDELKNKLKKQLPENSLLLLMTSEKVSEFFISGLKKE